METSSTPEVPSGDSTGCAAATPPRVVVAEDDVEMRRLLVSALRADGYDVREARDGTDLLMSILPRPGERKLAADLIVSDLRMPATSGLQMLRGLRSAGHEIPFILLTAFGDAQTRAEAESLGAMFFDKPFQLATLREAVHAILAPRAAG